MWNSVERIFYWYFKVLSGVHDVGWNRREWNSERRCPRDRADHKGRYIFYLLCLTLRLAAYIGHQGTRTVVGLRRYKKIGRLEVANVINAVVCLKSLKLLATKLRLLLVLYSTVVCIYKSHDIVVFDCMKVGGILLLHLKCSKFRSPASLFCCVFFIPKLIFIIF